MKRKAIVASLDEWFSKYVRLSNADDNGMVNCFTCGVYQKWNDRIDAGHFQTRAKYTTRWDEMNVKPQCKRCNMTNGGQQYTFGIRLDQIYGQGTAANILRKSNELSKFTNSELLAMRDDFKAQVKQMLKDLE